MKLTPLLLLVSASVFAYDQPKVEDPKTVLDKLDHIFSVKDTDVNLRGFNDVNLTHNFTPKSKVRVEGYGHYNISSRTNDSGLRLKLKW